VAHELTASELQEFAAKSDFHAKLWEYFIHPEKLEEVDLKSHKKANFIKTATKMITSYLKRPDLQLFY
jgi:hypothetical protein